MLKCEITEGLNGRIIVVRANDLMRYKLYDTNDKRVKFELVPPKKKGATSSNAFAVVTGEIKIYKWPNVHVYHREYMQFSRSCDYVRNRTELHDALPDYETFNRDMLEYEGIL